MRVRISKVARPVVLTRIERPGKQRTSRYQKTSDITDQHPVRTSLTGTLLNKRELPAEALTDGVVAGFPVRIILSPDDQLITSPVRQTLFSPDGESVSFVTASQNMYEIYIMDRRAWRRSSSSSTLPSQESAPAPGGPGRGRDARRAPTA